MIDNLSKFIPNFKRPRPHLITGGQPEAKAWKPIADAGVTVVVNLRPDSELPGRDEAQEVKEANLTYVNVPVVGPVSLNKEQALELWKVIKNSEGAVLVHCGTGNRCGALLALTEAWFDQCETEDAVAFGKQAGLSDLEPVVRDILKK